MMLIHGKVESVSLEEQNKKIVLTLKDQSQHKYLYNNNSIFFIIQENGVETKYITLCQGVDTSSFLYESNKLKTTVKIGEITYNNIFSFN